MGFEFVFQHISVRFKKPPQYFCLTFITNERFWLNLNRNYEQDKGLCILLSFSLLFYYLYIWPLKVTVCLAASILGRQQQNQNEELSQRHATVTPSPNRDAKFRYVILWPFQHISGFSMPQRTIIVHGVDAVGADRCIILII